MEKRQSEVPYPFSLLLIVLLFTLQSASTVSAANFYRKTVEVFGTGTAELKAYANVCSGNYVTKPDGTRGVVDSVLSEPCGGYERWRIGWPGETTLRWSAENWLRVIPCDLAIPATITISPTTVSPGATINVKFTIRNAGQGNAPPSCTKLSLKRAGTFEEISSDDEIATEQIIPTDAILFSSDFKLPDSVPPGSYIIYAEVDSCMNSGQTNYANDAKASPAFTVSPVQYTITSVAAEGGTISPSQAFTSAGGSSIIWTATPNSGYEVDTWTENNIIGQTGGLTYKIESISRNTEVHVSFKRKLYLLSVIIRGVGNFILGPAANAYAAGTTVSLECTPGLGYAFSECTGAHYSRRPQTSFTKAAADETIQLTFVPIGNGSIIIPTFANSTPSTLDMTVTTPQMWITVCQSSEDAVCWTTTHVWQDDSPTKAFSLPMSKPQEFVRTVVCPKVTTPPFLYFPLTNDYALSDTAQVTAVFDHARDRPDVLWSYTHNDCIGTFLGSNYVVPLTLRNSLGRNVPLPPGMVSFFPDNGDLKYVGATTKTLLEYDDHPGIDFHATNGTPIFASAKGVTIDGGDDCPSDTATGPALAMAYMSKRHALIIDHEAFGYCSVYMHLSSINPKFANTNNPNAWIPLRATIEPGEYIGTVGNYLVNCSSTASALPFHFHFELWRKDTDVNGVERWVFADPYGLKHGSSFIYPNLWLKQHFPGPVIIP